MGGRNNQISKAIFVFLSVSGSLFLMEVLYAMLTKVRHGKGCVE